MARTKANKPTKRGTARAASTKTGADLQVQNLRELAKDVRPSVRRNLERGEALVADIAVRKRRIAEDFHAIGRALRELSQPALYGAMGYDSFADVIKARRLMAPSTAYKLMAVADAYPEALVRTIGFEKAYAILRLVDATPAEDFAPTLVDQNPRIGKKLLATMTVREIQEATARVQRAAGSRAPDPERTAAKKEARTLQRALRDAGASSATVRPVRKDGRWYLRTDFLVDDSHIWTRR